MPGRGVGGDELVAPAVGFFHQRQLRPGRGPFAAADDPHVGGQLASRSPPTERRSSPVSSATPASSGSRGRPRWSSTWSQSESDSRPIAVRARSVQVEPDRVVHPPSGCGVQRGDVADQVQGGARAIAGDQQVPPVPGRELRDRLVEHLDVIEGGVAAGVARAQPKRQRLAGVVTPRGQRVMTPGALERARRLLLVAVRDLDRGVHADHDRLPQVAVGHPRGRDPPVPGVDQPPHVAAGPRPRRPRSVPAGPGRSPPAPATASSPRPPARTARPDPAAPPDRTSPGRRRRSAPRCRPAPGRGRAPG